MHWSTGLKNHGIVTVQLSSESSDQALIAELITIRHLLFTRQIFGRKPVSGKGYELRVFSGAIKKIAQGRSTKEHIVRYGLFLTGPMFGVQIAFKDFTPGLGIWGSPWAGFKHFKTFIYNNFS